MGSRKGGDRQSTGIGKGTEEGFGEKPTTATNLNLNLRFQFPNHTGLCRGLARDQVRETGNILVKKKKPGQTKSHAELKQKESPLRAVIRTSCSSVVVKGSNHQL